MSRLEKYEQLAYSKITREIDDGTTKTYKKVIETIARHKNTKYHQGNMVASQIFLMVIEGKLMNVAVQKILGKKNC